jgi:hypothetical protein
LGVAMVTRKIISVKKEGGRFLMTIGARAIF